MKKAIFTLVLLGAVTSAYAALGDYEVFVVARDNCNNFNDDEKPNNRGKVDWIRGAKGPYAECYYADWDTAAMAQWVTDNPLDAGLRYQFTFFIMPTGGWPDGDDPAGYEAELWTLNLLYDWEEGDADTAFTPYNWSPDTPAATEFYAQHVYYIDPITFQLVDDIDNCVEWTAEDGTTYGTYSNTDELHLLQNSTNFWANSDLYTVYIGAEVDEALWQDLLYNDLNRGLALKGTGWANSTIYSIEQDNPIQVPYMRIEIVEEFVPILGDCNDDGYVDGADYTVWADNYLSQPVPAWPDGRLYGNFNDDDIVDGADYTVWADNYAPPGSGVPEPATLFLLAIGAAAAVVRRRR